MIKFIYFDLGGVTIRDFSGTNHWEEFKKELGITPDKDEAFEKFWEEYEPKLCVGMDIESLIPLLKSQFGLQIPEGYSLMNAFVSRFETNSSIWPIIELYQQHFRVGLLTNMFPGMLTAIKEKGIMPKIHFEVVIDSSVEKVRKPDLGIFQIAQERCGFHGQEILLVENTPTHVQAAKDFGWQAIWYDPANFTESNNNLKEFLEELLAAG